MSSYTRLTDSTAMVDVATSALAGPALAYAVAVAEGQASITWCFSDDGSFFNIWTDDHGCYRPDRDWEIGGPLIDKHRISFVTIGTGPEDEHGNEPIVALVSSLHYKVGTGTTHLTAACRAIVATVLGETVSVPADLVPAVQP